MYNTLFFSYFRWTAIKTEYQSKTRYTCNTIIVKMSALLMVPLEDVSSSKSMSGYGIDLLVAVEMRNWLVRELDTTMLILELLANISLWELSRKIARKSKLVNPVILVGRDS